MVMGFALAAAGAVTQFVAWIGALINTYQLEDKIWFWVLLAGGVLGLASGLIPFATMVAYLSAGPEGLPQRHEASSRLRPERPRGERIDCAVGGFGSLTDLGRRHGLDRDGRAPDW